MRVLRRPRRDSVDGVQRHNCCCGNRRSQTPCQVGPHDPVRRARQADPEQLPRRSPTVVGAAAQALGVRGEQAREVARQLQEDAPVGAVGPREMDAGLRAPRRDVSPANRRSRPRRGLAHEEHVVGARLHAELRPPALAQGGEGGPQAAGDARRIGC